MRPAQSTGRGLSPVLGAVLIVSVTVVIFTVLGMFVFNYTQATGPTEQVTVDTHVAKGNVEVKVASGQVDQLLLLVNGSVEDAETNVQPGTILHAENVKSQSQITVLQEVNGQRAVVMTTRVLPQAGAPATYTTIGETGSLLLSTEGPNDWGRLDFENTYSNPVVIAKPVSSQNTTPVHIRLRNVTSTGADIKLEEWDYQDGAHTHERVHYIVLEAGRHTLEDGTIVEAGTVNQTGESFRSRSFTTSFNQTPVVFTQAQTTNETTAIVTRTRNVTASGFDVTLQEQENRSSDTHGAETIGYVAVEQRQGLFRFRYEVARTPQAVTNESYPILFENTYQRDRVMLAALQTYNESDPASLRYSRFTSSSVNVSVVEERSADSELDHAMEAVGYWVLNEDRDIIAR